MSDLLNVLKNRQEKLGRNTPDLAVTNSCIPLEMIAERPGGDTRQLNQGHVEALSESIALLGLIEPLVVDSSNRLVAGGHRKAAILHLRETAPEAFEKRFSEGVPVHRVGFDAQLQPDLAVQLEIAENEQRRDYTPAEVRAIADKFRGVGFRGTVGRPAKEQAALVPALMAVVGKSRRTVMRYLARDSGEIVPDGTIYDKALGQVYRGLAKWLEKPRKSKAEKAVVEDAKLLLQKIEGLIK